MLALYNDCCLLTQFLKKKPGTFDYEENGRMTEGSLRTMRTENIISLFPVRKAALYHLCRRKK